MAMIFHRAWFEAMSFMPEKDRADLMAAIMAYAFEEELPSSKNCSRLMLSVFCVIKDQIDAERGSREDEKGRRTNATQF